MKLSIKQVITLLLPYIDIGVAAVVTWCLVHLHWLGIFHINADATARVISSGIVFVLTAVLTWASHHYKWLPIASDALDRRQAAKVAAAKRKH